MFLALFDVNLEQRPFAGDLAIEHMRNGGEAEDSGLRFWNHFHDPLRQWDRAGFFGGRSSALWAQDQTDWLPTHTWGDAVGHFRSALTGGSAGDRDAGFARLFHTFGRLAHLLADLAVPEHVRNDGHSWTPLYTQYEEWCQKTLSRLSIQAHLDPGHPDNGRRYFDPRVPGDPDDENRPLQYLPSRELFAQSLVPGLSPVSNLWDARVASGYNPALGDPAEWARVGLAEYTNFNTLSWDTRYFWDPSRPYEHPAAENLFPRIVQVPLPAEGPTPPPRAAS